MRSAKAGLASACALLLATSFAAPASASKPDRMLDGWCDFLTMADPRAGSSYDSWLGYMYGGPITQNGTLTCTIKSGVSTHDAPYEYGTSVSATGTLGVTVLPHTPISYVANPWLTYLCTQFTDSANVTWYADDDTGEWTTDPHAACDLAIWSGPNPFLDPLLDLVDVAVTAAKPVVCPALAALSPGMPPLLDVRPDGDVYVAGDLLLDCPPETAGPGDGVASAAMPATYAERATPAGVLTSLRCEVDDGTGGPPVTPYVATCDFGFGA